MKRLLAMLALAIVVGVAVSACGSEDTMDELVVKSPKSEETGGTGTGGGNEGGNGGSNPPPKLN